MGSKSGGVGSTSTTQDIQGHNTLEYGQGNQEFLQQMMAEAMGGHSAISGGSSQWQHRYPNDYDPNNPTNPTENPTPPGQQPPATTTPGGPHGGTDETDIPGTDRTRHEYGAQTASVVPTSTGHIQGNPVDALPSTYGQGSTATEGGPAWLTPGGGRDQAMQAQNARVAAYNAQMASTQGQQPQGRTGIVPTSPPSQQTPPANTDNVVPDRSGQRIFGATQQTANTSMDSPEVPDRSGTPIRTMGTRTIGDRTGTVTPPTQTYNPDTNPDGTAQVAPVTSADRNVIPPDRGRPNPTVVPFRHWTQGSTGGAGPDFSGSATGPIIGYRKDGSEVRQTSDQWGALGASGNRDLSLGNAYGSYMDELRNPGYSAGEQNAMQQSALNAARSKTAGAGQEIANRAAASGNDAGTAAALASLNRGEQGALTSAARQTQVDQANARIAGRSEAQKGLTGLGQNETQYQSNLFGQSSDLSKILQGTNTTSHSSTSRPIVGFTG